jgi:hypothetical protein
MEIALFNKIPATHSQIDAVVADAREKILSGDYNPLDLEIQLKAMEETIQRIRKDVKVKEYVQEEVDKYPDKTFKLGSVTITKGSRKSYNFGVDPEWVQLKQAEVDAADQRKLREKKLKGSFVDSASGEIVEAIEPAKSTEFLTIRFDD